MTFLHDKDAGDILFSLASVQSLGGGDYFLKPSGPHRLLQRLVSSQGYIGKFAVHRGEHIDHDFSTFRKGGIPWGVPLAKLHSDWIKAEVDFSQPWLSVEPSQETKGKILVNRTARYTNRYFPWRSLVEQFHRDMMFIGLPAEWRVFCSSTGRHIPHLRTNDLYDVATAIAGSEVLIANQSSPNAIAEGLKHPLIQEACLNVPDCIFLRDNAHHCFDGNLDVEILGRRFVSEKEAPKQTLPVNVAPPGGWKVKLGERTYGHYCYQALISDLLRELKHDCPVNIGDMIQEYTISKLPIEALSKGDVGMFRRVRELIESYTVNSQQLLSVSKRSLPQSSGTELLPNGIT